MLRAADELRQRGLRRHGELRRDTEHRLHDVCYFRCGFCRFSAWLRGDCAARLPGPDGGDSSGAAARRGSAARRGLACGADSSPGSPATTTSTSAGRSSRSFRTARARLLGPGGLAGRGDFSASRSPTTSRRLRDVGLALLPGSAGRDLDDEVRRTLLSTTSRRSQSLEVTRPPTGPGLRSTSTIIYGSIEGPRSWARHLLHAAPAPEAAPAASGVRAVAVRGAWRSPRYPEGRRPAGPTFRGRDSNPHARGRPSRPFAHITNVQASWVKLGSTASTSRSLGAEAPRRTLMNSRSRAPLAPATARRCRPSYRPRSGRRGHPVSGRRSTASQIPSGRPPPHAPRHSSSL